MKRQKRNNNSSDRLNIPGFYFWFFFFRNQLARQYRTKLSELELKRSELNNLSEDFEAKLRRKEVGGY